MKITNKATATLAALLPLVVATAAVAYDSASASSAGADIANMGVLTDQIIGWVNGPLGTLIAVSCLIVGLGAGIMQQSIMAVVVGIGMAAAVKYGPGILVGITGASQDVAL